jgi:hypothetical protein
MKALILITLCASAAVAAESVAPSEPTLTAPSRAPSAPTLPAAPARPPAPAREQTMIEATAHVVPPPLPGERRPAAAPATPQSIPPLPLAPSGGTVQELRAAPVAPLVAPLGSISVSAKEVGTGKGIDRRWQTDYGSYSRDQYRTKALEVEIRNTSSKATGDCKVTACWVAREVSGARQIRIHHAETLPAQAGPVAGSSVRFWSPLMAEGDDRYVALGERYRSGSKIDGWFVIVSRDDVVIGGVGSTPAYSDLIKSPAKVDPLLSAYVPSGRSATSTMPKWRTDPLRKSWSGRDQHSKTERW